MSPVPPTVPAAHPNVPSTYHQVLATRDSSENTLRERGSSNTDEEQDHKNENSDNDAEEKAQEGSMKPVGFWDPSLAKTRKWVLLHWSRTSKYNIQPYLGNLTYSCLNSTDSLRLHSRHPITILGSIVQCVTKLGNSQSCCREL
jgi:hypothetical protein